jgi:regulator of protease activity HflC (stomatin/prohibitin superfamily)
MNCTAMIEERDAAKFLYRYNNTPLETIIDTDIKKMVEDEFNRATSQYKSTELHTNKAAIIETVKTNVTEYFKDYGITITVLGIKEGFSFENPEIQAALDAKFASEQDLVIQQNKNEANLAKAEAEAEAVIIAARAEAEAKLIAAEAAAEANRKLAESLTPEILQQMYYEAWNGELPKVVGSDGQYILPPDIFDDTEE